MSEEPNNGREMWKYTKDVLALAVIPTLVWVVKLEVGNAQRDILISQGETELSRLEERLDEVKDIDTRVQQNALHLARLEGKLDTANGRLDEIRTLLMER